MRIRFKLSAAVLTCFFALTVGALAVFAVPVQGSGETSAINAFQLQGPGDIRVGGESYAVVSTATILGIAPGPGHTLLGQSSHLIDFGGGNTITTMDEVRLVPIDAVGNHVLLVKAEIVGGTGDFANASGNLTFNGMINLALGQASWRVHGQIQ